MLTSMTGFGRSILDAPYGRLVIELQSVNRKYLEVFVSLPKELSRFEPEVRKWVAETISRGQVSVRIFLIPNVGAVHNLLPDPSLLKELKKGWEKIAREVGTDPAEISLSFLTQYLPARQEVKEEDSAPLKKGMDEALEGLLKMKKSEGKALAQDLSLRLKLLEKGIAHVEEFSPDATRKMREKLIEKMNEVLKMGPDVEERLLREVALFAERVDVTEEITRFKSHIEQFREMLKGGAVGRKMDFLIQEMGREVNTIGSKSMESKISHLVVEMKSELEKMREQIQNIE